MHDMLKTLVEMRNEIQAVINNVDGFANPKIKRQRDALNWAIRILEHCDLVTDV
jgi:hypothetical protein